MTDEARVELQQVGAGIGRDLVLTACERPLIRTSSGHRFDAVDVVNHLAKWLEPRLLAGDVVEVIEGLVEQVANGARLSQRYRLSVAARRWLVDNFETDVTSHIAGEALSGGGFDCSA